MEIINAKDLQKRMHEKIRETFDEEVKLINERLKVAKELPVKVPGTLSSLTLEHLKHQGYWVYYSSEGLGGDMTFITINNPGTPPQKP